MNNEMKEYLQQVAIQTKVENYKEFGKTKEETAKAIEKNFDISYNDALIKVDQIWDKSEDFLESNVNLSFVEKKKQLIYEKECKMQEYDMAIQVVEDAINGFSVNTIASQKGLSVEEVKGILGIS